MKTLVRVFTTALLPAVVLAGCATIPAGVFRSNMVSPQPLKLAIGYDVGLLRVDLKRGTHLERRIVMERDTMGVTKSVPELVKVENPYSLLVARFGNGLLVDRNDNLGIDLLRLYDLNRATSFNVVERFNGLLPSGRSVVRTGNSTARRGVGLTVEHLTAVAEGDIIHLRGQAFHPRMRIVKGPDSLSLEPAGRRNAHTTTVRQPSPERVELPVVGGTTTLHQTDPNHIYSSNGLDLTRSGNQIDIVVHAPGGIAASFVYRRTQGGCIVTSSNGYPTMRITRLGDKIYIMKDRFLVATVTIESSPQ